MDKNKVTSVNNIFLLKIKRWEGSDWRDPFTIMTCRTSNTSCHTMHESSRSSENPGSGGDVERGGGE